MSNQNTRRPQNPIHNPTQPRCILRPITTHLHDDFNRLTLDDSEMTQNPSSIRPMQQTQLTQRRQHPIWPASPPRTAIPGPAPSSTARSQTPFSDSNPFHMTPLPLPGTYPVTPIPPARTLPYQPLVPAQAQTQAQPQPQIRTPTPSPGYAEYDRQQQARMWRQDQILREHWPGMERGVDSKRGIESAQSMQILSNEDRSTSLMLPPSLPANDGSAPTPAPATLSHPRTTEEIVREISRKVKEMELEKERKRTRRITVRRGDARGEEVQVRGRRDGRETEQQIGRVRDKDEDDDEWEVVRGPGRVMVDDLVDSDDSDTWC